MQARDKIKLTAWLQLFLLVIAEIHKYRIHYLLWLFTKSSSSNEMSANTFIISPVNTKNT